MKKNKIVVGGSRDYTDKDFIYTKLDFFLQNLEPSETLIISGEGGFVDKTAKEYALDRGLEFKGYPAQWDDFSEPCYKKYRRNGESYNALAGFKRNKQMASEGTHYIAFWKGGSPGTKNMIKVAREHNLEIRIIKI